MKKGKPDKYTPAAASYPFVDLPTKLLDNIRCNNFTIVSSMIIFVCTMKTSVSILRIKCFIIFFYTKFIYIYLQVRTFLIDTIKKERIV